MPKRPNSHVNEDLSRNRLHNVFEREGWTVEDLRKDYGEDLLVRIFENSQSTPYSFFVQAKAVQHIRVHRNQAGDFITCSVTATHVSQWERFWEPVILTVWDATDDVTYWEYVQSALERAGRAGARRARGKTVRIRIPVCKILNDEAVRRIKSLTKTRLARFEQERNGGQYLIDTLREQFGMDINYSPQYGILMFPEGKFVPNPESGPRMLVFGRAAYDLEILARLTGTPPEQAFSQVIGRFLEALQAVSRGETFQWKGPGGEVLDEWKGVDDVSADYKRMLDESDYM
jgi:hypothetical protein